jgi:hypothetical protein
MRFVPIKTKEQQTAKGDHYLRILFVAGALAVIRCAKIHGTEHSPGSRRSAISLPP